MEREKGKGRKKEREGEEEGEKVTFAIFPKHFVEK